MHKNIGWKFSDRNGVVVTSIRFQEYNSSGSYQP